MKKILFVTEKKDWFYKHALKYSHELNIRGYSSKVICDHNKIKNKNEIAFVLSYYKLVNQKFLKQNKYNIVIHESNLPKGKGWAPLFWQIIEGKSSIDFTVFEIDHSIDGGDYYFKKKLRLKGDELYEEIRSLQANIRIECCNQILKNIKKFKLKKQKGKSTFYRKRTKKDSEININRSIKSQFNLLRSTDNKNFPAFFYYKKKKYILNIFKSTK
jgi:methionyl-tRNA formyltransferase